MSHQDFRTRIIEYVRQQAKPVEKFSHQTRLYALAVQVAANHPYDDDVLFAATWLHDLGVFIGHRPDDLAALAKWDNVIYAMHLAPDVLRGTSFPDNKIPAVVEAIRTHLPSGLPTIIEGELLRDADILEQLGAVGILRTVCKVGRDTRFPRFADAIQSLRRALNELPGKLHLDTARELAQPRIKTLRAFLDSVDTETISVAENDKL